MGGFRFFIVFSLITHYAILNICIAQDLERARGTVETLALPFFHGRGYVKSGDSLAAEFVAKEFKLCGLKTFQNTYFQSFHFPVNTFPGEMKVRINNKNLVTGKDYILDAGSKGIKGRFKIRLLDSTVFKPDSDPEKLFPGKRNKQALLYPVEWRKKINKLQAGTLEYLNQYPVVVQVVPKKLTFSVSNEADNQCTVQVLSASLPVKTKSIKLDISNKFVEKHEARNVISFIEGTSKKDSFLVITAHYDHLGQLGKDTYFPGANDNASGVAMMMELAHYYADTSHRLPYSVMFIGFAGEEAGLIGSRYYVNNPLFPLPKIKFLVNLDLLGSGKEGITVVNGSVFPKQFSLLDSLNKRTQGISKIVARGKAANSDHYPFSEKGVPAFFIYTNGEITAYHDIDDKPGVVTFSKFKEVFVLLTDFLGAVNNLQ